jgi:phytoene dehydrogenase-like protein
MPAQATQPQTLPREVDFVIIGAGHNGLTAGCYLAREGHSVAVVEASPTVGGMTSTNATLPSAPGHMFNEGAIQLTGIFRLSGIAQELELHKYGLRQISVDPAHVQLSPDGSSLAIWKDASRTADELRRFSPKDARVWLELANALDPAMDLVVAYMKSHPLRPWNAEMAKAVARAARHPKRLWSLRHMATASHTEFLEENFETELPKGALAAMAAFSQMRLDMTAWALIYLGVVQKVSNAMPVGGTGALPAALHRCLLAHGGTVHTDSRHIPPLNRFEPCPQHALDETESADLRALPRLQGQGLGPYPRQCVRHRSVVVLEIPDVQAILSRPDERCGKLFG